MAVAINHPSKKSTTSENLLCLFYETSYWRKFVLHWDWKSLFYRKVKITSIDCCIPQNSHSVTAHPHRLFKYLAVVTTDGSVPLWNYDLIASTNRSNKKRGAPQRWIELFCHLEASTAFDNVSESIFIEKEDSVTETVITTTWSECSHPSFPRYCTNLAWISPGASTPLPLLFLAAAFTDGIAVYMVLSKFDKLPSGSDRV